MNLRKIGIIFIILIQGSEAWTDRGFRHDIKYKYPSYRYVFSELGINPNFINNYDFINFVNKNEYKYRKNYIEILKRNKDVLFPTIIKEIVDSKYNYLYSYIPIVESGLSLKVKSSTGASGLWQFTKSTGKESGLLINNYVDQRNDPIISTIKGAEYVDKKSKELSKVFLGIMAYNSGAGHIRQYSDGRRDLGYLISSHSRIKAETKKYILKIILYAMIGENHRFKKDLEIQKLKDYSRGNYLVRISFDNYVNFRSAARITKVPEYILRKYNKQFKKYNPRFRFLDVPRSYL